MAMRDLLLISSRKKILKSYKGDNMKLIQTTNTPTALPPGCEWDAEEYNVTIELTQDMLGTLPKSKSIFAAHLASTMERKGKKEGMSEEEIQERIANDLAEYDDDAEDIVAGHTTFLTDSEGRPHLKDYHFKGFLKEAAKAKKQSGTVKQLRSKVVQFLFVSPVVLYFSDDNLKSDALEVFERPLRAETARGPRTTIARSDVVPAGTQISFTIQSLNPAMTEKIISQLLWYGQYMGLGCFRGGGWGRFTVVKFERVK